MNPFDTISSEGSKLWLSPYGITDPRADSLALKERAVLSSPGSLLHLLDVSEAHLAVVDHVQLKATGSRLRFTGLSRWLSTGFSVVIFPGLALGVILLQSALDAFHGRCAIILRRHGVPSIDGLLLRLSAGVGVASQLLSVVGPVSGVSLVLLEGRDLSEDLDLA